MSPLSDGSADMGRALVTFAYVSRSRIAAADAALELSRLVEATAREHFAAGITGALMYTGGHLAQIVEGPPELVSALREQLASDVRHEKLVELDIPDSNSPRFVGWGLAYSGPSSHFAGVLRELHEGRADPSGPERLLNMMRQFVDSERGRRSGSMQSST